MKVLIKKSELITIIVLVVLTVIFYLIKFSADNITESLYSNGNINTLNFFIGIEDNLSLEYYLGMMEEKVFGPVCMTISGIVFLIICLKYLKESSHKVFGLSIFFYLLLTRFEVLFYPPYGDTVSGPFIEAIWLLKHSFNYIALSNEPSFVAGGPKAYLFSIYPTYLAVLMKIFSKPIVFIITNHLLVFSFGAVTITFFRKALLKFYNKNISILISILFLSMPLFQSQVEQINMEMPLVMFSMIAIYYLANKNIFAAALMSILATMVKGVGILMCSTVFAISLFLFFFDIEYKFKIRSLIWGIIALIFIVINYFAAFYILNNGGKVAMVGLFSGWKELKRLSITYIYMFSIVYFLGYFVKEKLKRETDNFISFLKNNYLYFIMFVCAGAWYGLFINSSGAQARYRLLLTPLTLISTFFIFYMLIKKEKILNILLILTISFSFFCSYGLLYKPHITSVHSALERSLEYRNDLKLQMKLAKELENKYENYTIGAPFTIAQILAFPEFGFVSKQLDIIMYGYPCRYERIKNFTGLNNINVFNTVWVGYETNILPQLMQIIEYYPYGPEDKIIEELKLGIRKVTIFMGGTYIARKYYVQMQILKKYISTLNKK